MAIRGMITKRGLTRQWSSIQAGDIATGYSSRDRLWAVEVMDQLIGEESECW